MASGKGGAAVGEEEIGRGEMKSQREREMKRESERLTRGSAAFR